MSHGPLYIILTKMQWGAVDIWILFHACFEIRWLCYEKLHCCGEIKFVAVTRPLLFLLVAIVTINDHPCVITCGKAVFIV